MIFILTAAVIITAIALFAVVDILSDIYNKLEIVDTKIDILKQKLTTINVNIEYTHTELIKIETVVAELKQNKPMLTQMVSRMEELRKIANNRSEKNY